MSNQEKPWFAPKIYGYGAGLPIAWEGWLLIAAYLVIVLICGFLAEWDEEVGRPAAAVLLVPSTIALIIVCKNRTRGGWKWRWGTKDWPEAEK